MPAQSRAGIYAPATSSDASGKLQITLVKSPIGQIENQKLTVKALGLRRMHQTVIRPDTPSVRGMVYTIRHLVRVETAAEDAALGVQKPAAAGRGSGAVVVSRPAGREAEGAGAAVGAAAPADGGAAPGETDATA